MESDDVASGAVGLVSYVNQKNARMRAHTHMHIHLLYDYIYIHGYGLCRCFSLLWHEAASAAAESSIQSRNQSRPVPLQPIRSGFRPFLL